MLCYLKHTHFQTLQVKKHLKKEPHNMKRNNERVNKNNNSAFQKQNLLYYYEN